MGGQIVNLTSYPLTAAQRAAASKIVNSAYGQTTRGIMTTAPTMLVTGPSANTTIAGATGPDGAPQYLLDNALLRKTGPVRLLSAGNNLNGFVGAWTTTTGTSQFDGGAGWGVGIKTNSRYVEYNVSRNGKVETMRLRVDGQWAQAADYNLGLPGTNGFDRWQVRFDLSSTATRTVEAFWPNIADIVGINLVAGATIALPDTTVADVSAAWWGDSYIAGGYTGLASVRGTICQALGEAMGVKDIVPMGVGGQGWVTAVGGQTIGSRISLDASRIPAPDIVFAHGSLNDQSASAATAQANITAGLLALRAAYPNAWIVFFTGFGSTNGPTDAAHYVAFMAGAQAAADAATLVIDTSLLPRVASTGTLPNGLANDSPDSNHPGPNWTAYVSNILKGRVVAAISARAGL